MDFVRCTCKNFLSASWFFGGWKIMHKTKAISEAGKQKIYIDFVYTIIYSSPQYDLFEGNAGLSLNHKIYKYKEIPKIRRNIKHLIIKI